MRFLANTSISSSEPTNQHVGILTPPYDYRIAMAANGVSFFLPFPFRFGGALARLEPDIERHGVVYEVERWTSGSEVHGSRAFGLGTELAERKAKRHEWIAGAR